MKIFAVLSLISLVAAAPAPEPQRHKYIDYSGLKFKPNPCVAAGSCPKVPIRPCRPEDRCRG
ncbi:hypothetical protein FOMA001_g17043 [Fusarium oxysporum f. sp. matthiolae]|nr:hypothetical protein FOMA001_g17043 [Fusarium oxysporum f. sp. matthiolae]